MAIDEKTGDFSYTPTSDDRDEFAVWIWARRGAKHEKQKVYITPHPRLHNEFNVIEHVAEQPPDPASRYYTTFTEQDAGQFRFNQITDDPNDALGKQTVMTKKIEVSGVRLVIEQGGEDKGSLYNRLKDRTNLKELTLYADEVVIRCPLKVPGTDVTIWARKLTFEDAGNVKGQIDTSPLPVRTRSTKDVGLDGQKAGDIRLYTRILEMPGGTRFIANGSPGQDARHGKKGADGTDATVWDKLTNVTTWTGYGITLDWSDKVRDMKSQFTPTCIQVFRNDSATSPRASSPGIRATRRGQPAPSCST
jgi:hypothetical protein